MNIFLPVAYPVYNDPFMILAHLHPSFIHLSASLLQHLSTEFVDMLCCRARSLYGNCSIDSLVDVCMPRCARADAWGNEERDTRTKAVTLLEQLIKEGDDEQHGDELDGEETYARAKVRGLSADRTCR